MSDETTNAPAGADAGGPCPFLRALANEGHINGDAEPLGTLVEVVSAALKTDGAKAPPALAIDVIALVGSAQSLSQFLSTLKHGLRIAELRGGPLDKLGGGSRVLDGDGRLNENELARLDTFASDYMDEHGEGERGLNLDELTRMMDANFERPTVRRRRIDRRLMDGEWPVLLRVMGKTHGNETYLSIRELDELFRRRRLPQRVNARLTTR